MKVRFIYNELLIFSWVLVSSISSVVACDENSYIAEKTKASKLTPNTFHKLCPSSSSLSPPICGDGSAFGFYYSSPIKRRSSNKILLELMGGGACWDGYTCEYQSDFLSFPSDLDQFLGLSCSEIQVGLDRNEKEGDNGNLAFSMLCAQSLGDVDLRDYHTIFLPYCTQDVHSGSNTITYDSTGETVNHQGTSNMLSVLEWMYVNFPHPEHVVLTGCSAGGTALPFAYSLLHRHYRGATPISSILDSPVYLTPSYFLQNGMPNWNQLPLMKKLRFNYGKYSQSEDYSNKVMEHVLKRGSRRDQWGFVTHYSDPVSLAYFQHMSYDNGGDDNRRYLGEDNNNNDADESEWWSLLSSSVDDIVSSHSNVDSYILNSEGHCSFGLYYAQLDGGQEFQEWAGNLLQVRLFQQPSSRGWFWMSAFLGCSIVVAAVFQQRERKTTTEKSLHQSDVILPSEDDVMHKWSSRLYNLPFLHKASAFLLEKAPVSLLEKAPMSLLERAPVTIAYALAVTLYFIGAMTWHGIEQIIYNPSVGPSATTLNAFGINNPTLVIYHFQIIRVLLTSTLLCSGLITYVMVMLSLLNNIRWMERAMKEMASADVFASRTFLEVAALISLGSNILYACLGSGASCSSVAFVLGLQAFSSTMHRYHHVVEFPRPERSTIAIYVFTCIFLPFNSWIMMTSAIILGIFLALWVYIPVSPDLDTDSDTSDEDAPNGYISYSEDNGQQQAKPTPSSSYSGKSILERNKRALFGTIAIYASLMFILMVRIRRPPRMYEKPFTTGCDLMYTTSVSDVVESYGGFDENRFRFRRRLQDADKNNESDEDYMCAQFCIPHLVSRPFLWGANKYTGFDVQRGWCEDVGYGQHFADKTFSFKFYSIDVELYFDDNYDYNDGEERQ